MGKATWVNIVNRHKLEFLNRAQKVSVNDRVKRRIAERVEALAEEVMSSHTSKFLFFGTDVETSLEFVKHKVEMIRISSQYGDFDTNTKKRIESEAFDFLKTLHRELKNGYKVVE